MVSYKCRYGEWNYVCCREEQHSAPVDNFLPFLHHMCGPEQVNVNSGTKCDDDCIAAHSVEHEREVDAVGTRYICKNKTMTMISHLLPK